MVDCQANSRHLVGWLIEQLDAEKDALFLAAVKAHDPGTGAVSHSFSKARGQTSLECCYHHHCISIAASIAQSNDARLGH